MVAALANAEANPVRVAFVTLKADAESPDTAVSQLRRDVDAVRKDEWDAAVVDLSSMATLPPRLAAGLLFAAYRLVKEVKALAFVGRPDQGGCLIKNLDSIAPFFPSPQDAAEHCAQIAHRG